MGLPLTVKVLRRISVLWDRLGVTQSQVKASCDQPGMVNICCYQPVPWLRAMSWPIRPIFTFATSNDLEGQGSLRILNPCYQFPISVPSNMCLSGLGATRDYSCVGPLESFKIKGQGIVHRPGHGNIFVDRYGISLPAKDDFNFVNLKWPWKVKDHDAL